MWAIAWPFLVAAWLFLFVVFASCFFGRKGAGTAVGTDRRRWWPVRRGLRGVFYLSVGFGGLIVVVSIPLWYHWGQLHVRGVPVSATVVSSSLEYDAERSIQFTRVSYEFEAEADGQRRPFRREVALRGVHMMGCGSVDVLYDPTDPSDSRMVLEVGNACDHLLSVTSFLILAVASFLFSRRSKPRGPSPSAIGTPPCRTGRGT